MAHGQIHTSCLKQIFDIHIMYISKIKIPVHFNNFTGNVFNTLVSMLQQNGLVFKILGCSLKRNFIKSPYLKIAFINRSRINAFFLSFFLLFACQKSVTSSEEQDTNYCPLYL
jgi:hypothetical protein